LPVCAHRRMIRRMSPDKVDTIRFSSTLGGATEVKIQVVARPA